MKTIVKPSETEVMLARWRGAKAAIWLFHATHKRLVLRLMHSEDREDLYIVGIRCEKISGPFAWKKSCVRIEAIDGADEINARSKVSDIEAGFELFCSSVALVRGPSDETDDSLVRFLSEEQSGNQ